MATSRAPVSDEPTPDADHAPERGTALCLSGGGFRAMVFHVGAIWRLYDAGILRDVARVSSVSGGSITAAWLALKWRDLSFDPSRIAEDFVPTFVGPIRALASRSIDAHAIARGLLLPGSIGKRVSAAYRDALFGSATLQDLPSDNEGPRFVINATSMQSGVLWRFSRPYMGDYRVGVIRAPHVPLADAVAASSAFPPFLSPFILDVDPTAFDPSTVGPLHASPFLHRVVLSDGGVYDNLGLETAYKRYQTVIVSDGGGQFETVGAPPNGWARHTVRVLSVIDNQVRSLRKRQLIEAYRAGLRRGAYWGIRTNIDDYGLPDALSAPSERTAALAAVPTRLKRLDAPVQERLINWGYAVTDAAIRRHLDPSLARPADLPYPTQPV